MSILLLTAIDSLSEAESFGQKAKNLLLQIVETLKYDYSNLEITTLDILSVLAAVLVLCLYEFLVYKYVSHRALYNKAFNMTIAIIPFFLATVIMCLQSNVVVTLGAIGALAIIRFRTAVKDPVDMVYLLWSVHTGIVCGCKLYEIGALTSIVVTFVLLLLENVKLGRKPYVLIVNTNKNQEETLKNIIKKYSHSYRIKSRNFTSTGVDYAIELQVRKPADFCAELDKSEEIKKFSLIEYDSDDVI